MEEKTFVDDINRSVYDIKNEENDSYRIKQGLTPEIVEKISEEKHDPAWMREFRLKSLEIYNIHWPRPRRTCSASAFRWSIATTGTRR